jgi:hypothetical protein
VLRADSAEQRGAAALQTAERRSRPADLTADGAQRRLRGVGAEREARPDEDGTATRPAHGQRQGGLQARAQRTAGGRRSGGGARRSDGAAARRGWQRTAQGWCRASRTEEGAAAAIRAEDGAAAAVRDGSKVGAHGRRARVQRRARQQRSAHRGRRGGKW